MDPLSRKLNIHYPKVLVQTSHEMHITNHLLFIDDLKLLALNEADLSRMTSETERFFKVIGLEIKHEKSQQIPIYVPILLYR